MSARIEKTTNESHYLSMHRKILRLFRITAFLLTALICFVISTLYFQELASHKILDGLTEHTNFDKEFTEFSDTIELFLLSDAEDTEKLIEIQKKTLALKYLNTGSAFAKEYNKKLRATKTVLYTVVQETLDDSTEDSLFTAKEVLIRVVHDIRLLIETHNDKFVSESKTSEKMLRVLTLSLYCLSVLGILTLMALYLHAKRSLRSIITVFAEQEDLAIVQKEEAQKHRMHNQRLRSLGTIAKGMAHEINNPLAIIKGHLGILELQREKRGKEPNRHLLKIGTALTRVSEIVKKIGIYTSLETSELSELDLSLQLSDAFIKSAVGNSSVEITCLRETCCSKVMANYNIFEMAIKSILNNAQMAVEGVDKPKISVVTATIDGCFQIQVTDNGVGIMGEDLRRVFDPFFTKREIGQGIGLGLTMAHSVISSFGGELLIESKVNEGTKVTIKIPCVDSTSTVTAA